MKVWIVAHKDKVPTYSGQLFIWGTSTEIFSRAYLRKKDARKFIKDNRYEDIYSVYPAIIGEHQ